METKVYKDYPIRTLGKALIGLLVIVTGLAFGYAVYAGDGFEYYDFYILPALLALVGIIILYQAIFKRTVLKADSSGITFSYLGNKKVSWSDIESMQIVTHSHYIKTQYGGTASILFFTFIAVFLKPDSSATLPRQRFWRLKKHPAIQLLGREAATYIPSHRINTYRPYYKFDKKIFDHHERDRLTAEIQANQILSELESLRAA